MYTVARSIGWLTVFAVAGTLFAADTPNKSDELAAPFSFFLASSDVVGFKDCPEGFQLVNDGTLISSFGRFTITAGDPPRPLDVRVKTLYRDCLPIFEYGAERDGIRYDFRTWGAPAELDPRADLVAFVQVTMRNVRSVAAEAGLRAEFLPATEPDKRVRPCTPWYRDRFMDAAAFADASKTRVEKGETWIGEHIVFVGDNRARADASGAAVTYHAEIAPGAQETFTFRVPYVPIAADRKEALIALRSAKPDETFRAVERFWEERSAAGARLELPEAKPADAARAGLCYLLCARDVDETGRRFTQKVNEFQYDDFYPRDSAYMIRAYEMYGWLDIARETLESYLVRDAAGAVEKFLRMPQHPDDWGQSLWTLGAYYRTTGDTAFAREVLPGIAPHLDDFEKSIQGDPLGLWPVAPPYDNELIDGHYTGHNFWAVLGLSEAQNLALAAGDKPLAERAQKLLDGFLPVLMKRLEKLTAETGGYIPPGLDDPSKGFDWENATGGLYPFGVLAANHPWVAATVDTAREYKWREGISTWGPNGWLIKQQTLAGGDPNPGTMHHYQTFNVLEQMLAMGRQRDVIEDLYSILAHTSSTHAGFELGMDPWGDRDPGGNFPPHGWYAARYWEFLRNMLVREEGEVLHLASALSPQWVRPGDVIRFLNAPTYFGPVSLTIASREDGADVQLDAQWRTPPQKVVLHVPWFVSVESAKVNGKAAEVLAGGMVVLSDARKSGSPPAGSAGASPSRCSLVWRWRERPDLSYRRAVDWWLSKAYDARPETDRNFLFPRPARPKLAEPRRMFTDVFTVRLLNASPAAEVRYTLDGSEPTAKSAEYQGPFEIRETTTLKAIELWPDGRTSVPLAVTLRRAECRPADVSLDQAEELTPGLRVSVWDGDYEVVPDFTKTDPQKVGVAKSFDLAATGREHGYAACFSGFIRIPKDGVYAFTVGSDDGSRLWIGDELVVDNDTPHPYAEVTGEIALRAGFHPIKVGYFEIGGASYLRAFYEGPDLPRQIVPPEALYQTRLRPRAQPESKS